MAEELLPRHLFAKVRDALQHHRIVSVVGARQVGKSTLVRQLRAQEPDRFDLVDLDLAHQRDLVAADRPAYLDRADRTLIIDEVQRSPGLMLPLKAAVDRDPRAGRFLLTGSADLWAVQERQVRDSLAGRVFPLRLWGLSQTEIEEAPSKAIDALLAGEVPADHSSALSRGDYLRRAVAGGFPGIARAAPSARRDHLVAYADSRTREDATDFGARRRYLSELPSLLRLLAARSAQEFNAAALAQDFPVSAKSVPAYVDLLEQLYLVDRVPAWSRNLGKRVINKPKMIVSDSGLMAALLGLRSVGGRGLNRDQMAGPLLETFVAGEVLRLASLAEAPVSVHHLRGHDGVEVDLVLEADDGSVIGLEVKAGSRPSRNDGRGLRHLRDKLGSDFVCGLVLHSGPESERMEDRIVACPIDVLWRWPRRSMAMDPELRLLSADPARRRSGASLAPHESPSRHQEKAVTVNDQAVPGPKMFVGYARDDEDATGAVSTIEVGVKRAFRVITTPAQELTVFRDITSLRWGDDWQQEIDAALEDSAFYVPVLSPRFFDSPSCRDEAEKFLERVERDRARRERLVLPVLLIDVPDLGRTSTDLLKAKMAGFHWVDLRDHVASAPEDPALKRLLWTMASSINQQILAGDRSDRAPGPGRPAGAGAVVDDELDLTEMLTGMNDVEEDSAAIAMHLGEVTEALGSFFEVFGPNADPRDVQVAAQDAAEAVEVPLAAAEASIARVAVVVRQFDDFISQAPSLVEVGAISPKGLIEMADNFEGVDLDLAGLDQARRVMKLVGFTSRSLREPMRRLDSVMAAFGDIAQRLQSWSPALRRAAAEAQD